MKEYFYFYIRPENHQYYVSENEYLKEGISYEKVYKVKPASILSSDKFLYENKPSGIPDWIVFSKAIRCHFELPKKGKYLKIEKFTDKLMVFDSAIASLVTDQYYYDVVLVDEEERDSFYTGLTMNEVCAQYWATMMTLSDYLLKKPYVNPEILIFEDIPRQYLSFGEVDKLS
ncbi:hypothetical protein D3C77_384400 [compost metagenome]